MLVAEEGVPLPAKREIKAIRRFGDSLMVIDVYLADTKIGEVRVENIPEEAGEGCPVILNVEITAKNEMRGEAQVQLRNGTVAVRCPVRVDFPPIPVPDLPDLKLDFDELKAQRDQLEELSMDPAQRLELAGQGKKLVRKVEKLLGEQQPDRQELQRAIKELRRLVEPPVDDMDPPRGKYLQLLEECNKMLSDEGADKQIQSLRPILSNIEKESNDAFTTKNQRKWSQEYKKLEAIYQRIKQAISGGDNGPKQQLPPTPILKDHFRDDVDQLRVALENRRMELHHRNDYDSRYKPRLDRIDGQIDQIYKAIEKVDDNLKPEQALGQLQLAMRPKAKVLEALPTLSREIAPDHPLFGGQLSSSTLLTHHGTRYRESSQESTEAVDCTVFAPPETFTGNALLVQVFLHLLEQTDDAKHLAQEFDEETRQRGFCSLEVELQRGTKITIHLTIPGTDVDDPVQQLVWRGRPASVQFSVNVPKDRQTGTVIGTVIVYLDTLPIGHIKFKLKIKKTESVQPSIASQPIGDARRYTYAFISYASKDRDEVLKRVQMLDRCHIDFFQDILALDPGERWENKLYEHIDRCDLFLLFWSASSRDSEWVQREVKYALARKGDDDLQSPEIIPILIEGPPVPLPPSYLSHLHFNDRLLYFFSRL